MERNIILKFKNGGNLTLRLDRGASVETEKKFINLEQMNNGYWRVVWSKSLFREFSEIEEIQIERLGDEKEEEVCYPFNSFIMKCSQCGAGSRSLRVYGFYDRIICKECGNEGKSIIYHEDFCHRGD